MCRRTPWPWRGPGKATKPAGQRRSERRRRKRGRIMTERLKIFTGNANRALAEEICKTMKVPLGRADVGRFSDGELQVRILENVRGDDTFLVQPTSPPVNDH